MSAGACFAGFLQGKILEEASSISDNAWTLILPALETN